MRPEFKDESYVVTHFQKLLDEEKFDELYASCDEILAELPESIVSLNYKGMVHLAKKEYDEAFAFLDQAYKLNPKEKYIAHNRIAILSQAGKQKEVEAAYSEMDESLLEDNYSLGTKFHSKLDVNDWSDYYGMVEKIKNGINKGNKVVVGFASGYHVDSAYLQAKANAIWVKNNCKGDTKLGPIPKRERKEKIRVGYFSADFFMHVCMQVLPHLFEVHDRDKFEFYAFSFSSHEDEMTARIETAFAPNYIRVADKTHEEIALLARELEIDIAVDLNGLTGGGRPEVFGLRAAPIQINFLGFPGSIPSDYMDYIIGDHTLIPSDNRMHFSEKVIYMPDTYQPTDNTRPISDRVFTRDELNLPKNAFVYACFCSIVKITPPMFDLWMDILKQVPNSVLWVKKGSDESVANLIKEAKARGVPEGRLVFAEPIPGHAEYMKSLGMADVFLDTWPFSAHATASDAIWGGLPVISFMGDSFPARVSSSVLYAAWLPELITKTKEDYVNLAVELGRNPAKLRVIKSKLERNRAICPLFNNELYARYLEIGFRRAYERYQAGLAPDHIYIGA